MTGGDEGIALNTTRCPDFLVGVAQHEELYWVALGYAASSFLVARAAIKFVAGHVWQAIRENERRVEVIGLRPYDKLLSFVLASFLAAWGGFVWLLLIGHAGGDDARRSRSCCS